MARMAPQISSAVNTLSILLLPSASPPVLYHTFPVILGQEGVLTSLVDLGGRFLEPMQPAAWRTDARPWRLELSSAAAWCQCHGHPAPGTDAWLTSTCPVRAATASFTCSRPRH